MDRVRSSFGGPGRRVRRPGRYAGASSALEPFPFRGLGHGQAWARHWRSAGSGAGEVGAGSDAFAASIWASGIGADGFLVPLPRLASAGAGVSLGHRRRFRRLEVFFGAWCLRRCLLGSRRFRRLCFRRGFEFQFRGNFCLWLPRWPSDFWLRLTDSGCGSGVASGFGSSTGDFASTTGSGAAGSSTKRDLSPPKSNGMSRAGAGAASSTNRLANSSPGASSSSSSATMDAARRAQRPAAAILISGREPRRSNRRATGGPSRFPAVGRARLPCQVQGRARWVPARRAVAGSQTQPLGIFVGLLAEGRRVSGAQFLDHLILPDGQSRRRAGSGTPPAKAAGFRITRSWKRAPHGGSPAGTAANIACETETRPWASCGSICANGSVTRTSSGTLLRLHGERGHR